jgi:hypothetical protein
VVVAYIVTVFSFAYFRAGHLRFYVERGVREGR